MLDDVLSNFPVCKGAVVVLSGGMDSATIFRLAVHKYGCNTVRAIVFKYGQRQIKEVIYACKMANSWGIPCKIVDIEALSDIAKGFSANTDTSMVMPGAAVAGQRATTYVPNRNMILLGFAAAYAEVYNMDAILFGSQSMDTSHDNNMDFMQRINNVLAANKQHPIKVFAPLYAHNKADEIRLIQELDGNTEFFSQTLTCYNPKTINEGSQHLGEVHEVDYACGKCSACLGRLKAFAEVGIKDPIPYMQD